jgi:hypothetical protein
MARVSFAPDETDYPSDGCDFNRPRQVIIRAAPTRRLRKATKRANPPPPDFPPAAL